MNGTGDPRTDFKIVFEEVKRPGAAALLAWLENETDFFTAPASSRNHLAVPGGLLIHSLNVYAHLWHIATRDIPGSLTEEDAETVAVLALLHDVCKAGVYHQETKRRKNPDTGLWEDYQAYTFRDPLPLGHGEKSLYLIARYMELTPEEALAIRWHMGAYDDAAKTDNRTLTAAMGVTPWVYRLQEADMCATWVDEREV